RPGAVPRTRDAAVHRPARSLRANVRPVAGRVGRRHRLPAHRAVVAGRIRFRARGRCELTGHPFDDIDVAALRRRNSVKWSRYDADVLPLWVAETDFPLADPFRRTLHELIDRGDTG